MGAGRPAGPDVPRLPRDRSAALVRAGRAEHLARRQALVLALLAELLDQPDLERALDAFAGALQERFGSDRVAIALARTDGSLHLRAVSQQAELDAAGDEATLLVEAMAEAVLAERSLCWPPADDRLGVLAAHRALAGRANRARPDGPASILSVPLYADATTVGALLLERAGAAPFDPRTAALVERVALAAAPLLALHRRADRGAATVAADALRGRFVARPGPRRSGARALVALGTVVLAALAALPVERRVTAPAELVSVERRFVTAPVAGYVDEVLVAAGDRVVAGQPLARLDRRELELEALRRDGELAGAEAELRATMASHDRGATAVARSRLERVQALRDLVGQRLERSELRAPVAGTLVDAEREEVAGAPVARGDVLFEIAPRDDFEVHLLVDEADVRDVVEGQRGRLALKARPGRSLELVVDSIHPVAESGDGASRFRVRASLVSGDAHGGPVGAAGAAGKSGEAGPRPGESGVARLDAGRSTALGALLRPLARRLAELRWRIAG